MKFQNPIVSGFYPDPSVCRANGKYYMVCSTFQYFPGVPLFESSDLINWKQIGHCLTRESQIMLDKINSSGGVFAPTIRYNDGRFYMVTTNDTTHQNFYVFTDDIYGEWSEPITVEQGGIDPSLYFEGDKVYFMSNGSDDNGIGGVVQCEINIETGKKLSPSKTIWQGTGGRYLEAPHLYKINNKYYLLAAEGGTEYGHMETYAVSDAPFGKFVTCSNNPILTNRDLGGYEIQGAGHGDLVEDNSGNWWLFHLAFRQSGRWSTYHHLGREVFLVPITFDSNGLISAGENGIVLKEFETDLIANDVVQNVKKHYTFENTCWDLDWCFLRVPCKENYILEKDRVSLKGTEVSLDEADSPSFICIRQKDFCAEISCDVRIDEGEAGITIYMDENHHYDLAMLKTDDSFEVIERLNVGDIKSVQNKVLASLSPSLTSNSNASDTDINKQSYSYSDKVKLIIRADNYSYNFFACINGEEIYLGSGQTRYLSSEVAGGFTGVVIGLYAYNKNGTNNAEFTNFSCLYQ
ncbi:MAG: glycoside hydrolase family 43 protein [Clostridiales bacterium]|nr:glycoside hydrolase family 43 protein [Clostridiales bacterium]